MAQAIRNLTLGSKVIDSRGNKFIVIAKDHYTTNEVTLLSEDTPHRFWMHHNDFQNIDYSLSEVHYYLNTDYLSRLDTGLINAIKVTKLPYTDAITTAQYVDKFVNTKAFVLSCKELGLGVTGIHGFENEFRIDYVSRNRASLFPNNSWTRTEESYSGYSHFFFTFNGSATTSNMYETLDIRPVINVNANVLVSSEVSNGYYRFIFNEPPVINTIQNMQGNYGSGTKITYIVADKDDSELNHFISFDNGGSWTEITPSRANNTFVYSHVFNELGEYNTRIKVVDSANNEVTSNLFIISINATNPTVNIVSVVDKVVTFKANCITSEISKVEILINGQNVKTFTSGFDFNIVYEIDRSKLNIGKNSIQIKATSQENLVGYANLEASKTKYNLPPVGTKVIINGVEYSISNASENGSNQTYTLNNNLINQINQGDIVQITQDSVKVLCAMSNLENVKDYKEMKLVKTKKLKGDLEGYVEEKYELQGEGRYSTVKLEMQRFSNNVATEILELQQYFDYLED